MKEYAFISWNFHNKGGARAAFKMLTDCDLRHEAKQEAGIEMVEEIDDETYRWSTGTSGSVRLLRTDPRLPRLLQELRRRGIDSDPRVDRVYSKSELDAAKWLVSSTSTTMVTVCDRPGQRWNFKNSCPTCGAGSRPVPPLFVRFARFPKTGWVVPSAGLIVVTPEIGRALTSARLTGFKLQPADPGPKRRKSAAIQWLEITSTWPRCSARSIMSIDHSCPECGRDGRFSPCSEAFELHYDRPPRIACDFNHTWELLGSAAPRPNEVMADDNRPTGGAPMLIVSQRARQVLTKAGVRLGCEPVFFASAR